MVGLIDVLANYRKHINADRDHSRQINHTSLHEPSLHEVTQSLTPRGKPNISDSKEPDSKAQRDITQDILSTERQGSYETSKLD